MLILSFVAILQISADSLIILHTAGSVAAASGASLGTPVFTS